MAPTIMGFATTGGVRRRCDASCHAAKGKKCVCVCGGKYHGSAKRLGRLPKNVEEATAPSTETTEGASQ